MTVAVLVASFLQPLENAARWLLDRFHYNLGLPWAWAIVATTVVVRIALVPLAVKQIHSMQSLQKHAPEMKELQKKYKSDRKKQQEEMLKFYKENNINPAASCLPMVAQFPIFIALYLTLKHFSKHAHSGSLSWLHIVPSITAHADSHWSGFLLLAIYAGSQVLSSYFMSATMDKAQRILMMFLPVVFITVVAHFPTGLVLYWVTTNLWTVGQGLITRRLMPKTPMPNPFAQRRSSRTAPAVRPGDNGAEAAKPADGTPKPKQPQVRRVKRKKGGGRR